MIPFIDDDLMNPEKDSFFDPDFPSCKETEVEKNKYLPYVEAGFAMGLMACGSIGVVISVIAHDSVSAISSAVATVSGIILGFISFRELSKRATELGDK